KLGYQPLPENDPQKRRPDISKAREILGWEPRVSRAEGLRRTLEYFKEHVESAPVEAKVF
ncbi:SDR family NAD-dependent epimerase/dehydratase, partial [Rufibacter sp. H-1]|nr:SDR family NAD-dependent epimerase/dehydratase [Rufibacter sediminis]